MSARKPSSSSTFKKAPAVQVSGVPEVLFGPKLGPRTMNALERDEELELKAKAKGSEYTSKLTEEDPAPRGSAFRHAQKLGNDGQNRKYRLIDSKIGYSDMFHHTLRVYPNAVIAIVSVRGLRPKVGFPLLHQTVTVKGRTYAVVGAIFPDHMHRAYGLVCLNPV